MKTGFLNRRVLVLTFICFSFLSLNFYSVEAQQAVDCYLKFTVSFPAKHYKEALDGRVLLIISKNGQREPRFQITYRLPSQLIYGVNAEGLKPGDKAVIDKEVFGFPVESIADIPPGEYYVQAVLHIYETFHRSDGHVVKLPMDRGEGQHWNRAPGNLYSTPKKIKIDPSEEKTIDIVLDKKMPPIPSPPDTKYIKHIKIKSDLLTKFWGRPIHLGAHVLLPAGFEEHPETKYPLMIFHGHFPYNFSGFRETPADRNAAGYRKTMQEAAYKFYKEWTGTDFPRMIIIQIQHANPYYDDSYAVNSANLGPYGDAITYELIPYIEKKFRGIGEGWARFLYGGSTGGWEALAVQVFYPDEYNGCWASCPDPVDFRFYELTNIYEHENAYYYDGEWFKIERPGMRNWLGEIKSTVRSENHMELALGTRGRSGEQFDIWEAVFSPVDKDGYPKRIWDKRTGKIDREVAEYWKENYDLRYILQRDWKTLGPKLKGKLNIYTGDMDSFYLNNAVYLMEEFLESTKDPYYEGEVKYGDRAEHCWSGDPNNPNEISRLTYNKRFVKKAFERILKSAPSGADLKSWRY